MKTRWPVVCPVVAAAVLVATMAFAQSAPAGDSWRYQLDVYGWGTGMSGEVGPETGLYQVSASFSDLTKYLDFAAMGHFEASKGRWGLMADAFYVNLGHSIDSKAGIPVKLNLEEGILSLEGTYLIYGDARSTYEVTFGARYNEVRNDITPYLLPPAHSTLSWTDPVVGFKGGVKMGKTWSFGYRFDVGGFGAGSDLSFLGVLRFDARLSKSTSLALGYAAYKVDYETGSGGNTVICDTTMQGPFLGVSFRW